ncbi:hypothetical protein N7532_000110 [Penicillium argentinense]|uniref:ditrans,polycis-polyprenyl diphosphate synthase [(2E,6E)-farnesyldiphosphate specific] n=1 Tax=Penicillium argentinense TaxID=1131581 RepID=A0A9W9KMY4_9EURO|nr:uncharacterized protein N7532_000110 [Penicillium argentinense]KAJ5112065.1 hypothetical protein N7532_000110 [Penicillium argentinense]
MVSPKEREVLRAEVRARNNKLSAADREALLKPYLPDPADLTTSRHARGTRKPRKTPIRTFIKSQIHHLTYALTHIIFGIVVRLIQTYHAVVDRVLAIVYHHHRTPELIRKDVRGLKRLPQHLSVILTLRTEDDALAVLMDEVAELAAWCTCAGIGQLSVYEKTGVLKSCIPALHQIITTKLASYYGTPSQQPSLQLYAPHHPIHGTRSNSDNPSLTLLLLSSTDGRETIVDLTKTLAEMSQSGKLSPEDITPELVDAEITEITTHPLQDGDASSGDLLKPEPDLLLVFGPFLKLDGYPPWQIRLTEMYCTGDRSHGLTGYGEAVEYQGFMRGLWHYAGAQMRFGR